MPAFEAAIGLAIKVVAKGKRIGHIALAPIERGWCVILRLALVGRCAFVWMCHE
jgi:hypothetical protein